MQNIETLKYKPDYIFNRHGVYKTVKELDNDKKIILHYLENLTEDDSVVGYTKLKVYSEKKSKADAILGVSSVYIKDNSSINNYAEFEVKEKKKRTQKLIGYVPVGENKFIGLIKSKKIPILLPLFISLLLFLGIGIWQALPNTPSIPEAIEEWIPDIQDNLGKQNEKEKSEIGSIEVKGFSKWHVPAGQKDNLTIALENPASNRCYFTFTMTLDDTNEVLYQSKMVPPGEGIYQITLSKPLEAGEYNATVFIKTNEVETGAEMNSCEIKTVIISD